MGNFLSGSTMGFREGLEAFLLISIMLQYVIKLQKPHLVKNIWLGTALGIGLSLFVGLLLKVLGSAMENAEQFATIWESAASFIALALVTTFIIWMIKHGRNLTQEVKTSVQKNLSPLGITLLSLVIVAREGAEIAIFSFAGEYSILPVLSGILLSLVLSVLIFYSLVKVKLSIVFNITLAYLILQAGLLLGYSIHEALSALKDVNIFSKDHWLYIKVFNLSNTIMDHKKGILGVPLYAILGWYSRPEWIQFIVQYGYTIAIFLFWKKSNNLQKQQ